MTQPKAKLLVVEDEPNLLLGIRDILELDGYDVVTAQHGRQALEALREAGENLPNLIVSDIMMPYMDGLELLQHVRKEPNWEGIPFIFLTAKGEKQDINLGRQQGVDQYLVKPFDAEDLLVTVSSTLKRFVGLNKVKDRAVDNVKNRILTILNHEFRTPLMLVVAYSDMLNESQANIQDMSEDDLLLFLREINGGADRMRRLVENFMLLVEIDTGEAEKNYAFRKRAMTDLEQPFKFAINEVFYRRGVEHTCLLDLPGNLPPVVVDSDYLMVMLRELLSNAVKFSEPQHAVEVRVVPNGKELHIHVADKGRGISPAKQTAIFEAFEQVNRHITEDPGAGSGLAIVHGLAKIHGGDVRLDSTEGEGSTFTLVLPIHES